jgi:Asp-tRNA(Asn)/Glu-tRNA(Gln) amidotransferase A subunit family amidase
MGKLNKYFLLILTLFSISLYKDVEAMNFKAAIDITTLNVYEIQDAIDKGYLTYELLTRLYLDRINEYDKKYNALISINEKAIEQAKQLDQEYKKNGRRSLLHGIPVIVKDNIDYKDLPTTAGTIALKDSYPFNNAAIVDNLINAGCIILGKSNMSEFAFSAYSSYSSYGNVRNAYNLAYTPYGSSGGSAVSVAASFATLAIGTDTNSSVRLPSGANNIVGLRPTYGLLNNDGIITYDAERDTAGPMTKTVSDNAILLSILADNGIDYTTYLKEDGLKNKKIGILTQFINENINSSLPVFYSYYNEIDNMMKDAIAIMEQKGATIVYIDDFYSNYYQSINNNTSLILLLCYDFNQYIKNTSSSTKSFEQLLKNGGFIQPLNQYDVNCNNDLRKSKLTSVNKEKNIYRSYVENTMKKHDVDILVYPQTKNKLIKLSDIYKTTLANNTRTIAPTTGFPAISIPLGFDSDDLPYGIEFLALANQENILYEISYSFEQATNYRKNPSISPSLYTYQESVVKLKDYYEKNIINRFDYEQEAYNDYVVIFQKVKHLLLNYNSYDDDIINDYSNELLKDYEEQLDILANNKIQPTDNGQDENNNTLLIIISSICTLLVIISGYYMFIKRKNNIKLVLYNFI